MNPPIPSNGAPTEMAISEASKLLGIPVPTIRSWERRYGFPSPARTDGKHRRYTLDEISTLRAVRDEITRGHPAREAVAIVRSGAATGGRRSEYLDRFTESAGVLDPDGVRRALEVATEIVGVERAIIEVALPGMREMGDRWRSGRCDVANEHLATQAVRAVARPARSAHPAAVPAASAGARLCANGAPHDRLGGDRGDARSARMVVQRARRHDAPGLAPGHPDRDPWRRGHRHRPAERRAARR